MNPFNTPQLNRGNPRYSVYLLGFLLRKERGKEKFVSECDIYNLSVKGCRIFSEVGLEAGRFVELRIMLPHHEDPIQINLSYIRWARYGNSGLEFRLLTAEDQEHLQHFVTDLHMKTERIPFV